MSGASVGTSRIRVSASLNTEPAGRGATSSTVASSGAVMTARSCRSCAFDSRAAVASRSLRVWAISSDNLRCHSWTKPSRSASAPAICSPDLLLLAEIGVEARLGVDQALARIEQLELRGEILGDQLLVDVLCLARQPDLLRRLFASVWWAARSDLVLLDLAFGGAELCGVFVVPLAKDVALRRFVGVRIARIVDASGEFRVDPVEGRVEGTQLGTELIPVGLGEGRVERRQDIAGLDLLRPS